MFLHLILKFFTHILLSIVSHIYIYIVANSERHYFQEHRIKAPKLTGSWGNCVLIFCPIPNISEPAHLVRLCSTRMTVLWWHWALETAIKILLIRGRILLQVELVPLPKTSVLGSQVPFYYSSLEPWEASPASVLPGSFLGLLVPEATPASLPPGPLVSAEAYHGSRQA